MGVTSTGTQADADADAEICPSRREASRMSLGVRIFRSDGAGELGGVISVWTSDESDGTEKRRDAVDSKPYEVVEWSTVPEPSSDDEVDMMIGWRMRMKERKLTLFHLYGIRARLRLKLEITRTRTLTIGPSGNDIHGISLVADNSTCWILQETNDLPLGVGQELSAVDEARC